MIVAWSVAEEDVRDDDFMVRIFPAEPVRINMPEMVCDFSFSKVICLAELVSDLAVSKVRLLNVVVPEMVAVAEEEKMTVEVDEVKPESISLAPRLVQLPVVLMIEFLPPWVVASIRPLPLIVISPVALML